jgi:hypothetical protein
MCLTRRFPCPQSTFTKRKNGLLKKAMELSVLCGADVALVCFDEKGRLFEFGSSSAAAVLARHARGGVAPAQRKCNADVRAGRGVAHSLAHFLSFLDACRLWVAMH